MDRVLITGANGFIGSAITAIASQQSDWEIYAVTSGRRLVSFPISVHPVVTDLSSSEQRHKMIEQIKPVLIIHLAWNMQINDFLESDENLLWFEYSLELIRDFINYGGKRFVFSGSSAEYGYDLPICKESQAGNPSDLYGVCKTSFARVAQRLCMNHGVEFVNARLFSVYGPGERRIQHVVPLAINTLLSGKTFTCKAPNNIWDYIYISDAAKAMVQISHSNFCGSVNIASGIPTTMRELFGILGDILNCTDRILYINEGLLPRTLVADTMILNRILSLEQFVDLRNGLTNTINWWKDQQLA